MWAIYYCQGRDLFSLRDAGNLIRQSGIAGRRPPFRGMILTQDVPFGICPETREIRFYEHKLWQDSAITTATVIPPRP
jgi:hypothetical protein